MSGEAMAQRMGMDGFFQARALSGLLASVTRRFRIDGVITCGTQKFYPCSHLTLVLTLSSLASLR